MLLEYLYCLVGVDLLAVTYDGEAFIIITSEWSQPLSEIRLKTGDAKSCVWGNQPLTSFGSSAGGLDVQLQW
jgi:hypothetical protein